MAAYKLHRRTWLTFAAGAAVFLLLNLLPQEGLHAVLVRKTKPDGSYWGTQRFNAPCVRQGWPFTFRTRWKVPEHSGQSSDGWALAGNVAIGILAAMAVAALTELRQRRRDVDS